MELFLNAFDLMPRGLRLLFVQLRGSVASQPPLRASHDRYRHFQVA